MSTDRLYLIHNPTQKRVLLGKLFKEWYSFGEGDTGLEKRIEQFFYDVGHVPGHEFTLESEWLVNYKDDKMQKDLS